MANHYDSVPFDSNDTSNNTRKTMEPYKYIYMSISKKIVLAVAIVLLGCFATFSFNGGKYVGNTSAYTSDSEFDFIVIGGGPAGSVMSRRLVDSGARVLLLEAGVATQHAIGGRDRFAGPITRFDIPFLWSAIPEFKEFHWPIPMAVIARGLGGCGIHNAMVYVRALQEDILKWNVTGWTWPRALAMYKKMERYIVSEPVPDWHGTDGPIVTSYPDYIDQVAPLFISSAVQSALPLTTDFNAPDGRVGVGYYNFNIFEGKRDSAAVAMLASIVGEKNPPNFNVSLESLAIRILLEPYSESDDREKSLYENSYKAVGVEYHQNGQVKTAYIKNQKLKQPLSSTISSIIVTAGAILTPKILMNSGIGPKDTLDAAGVEVLVESNNVGKNLQDHPAVGLTMMITQALAATYPFQYDAVYGFADYINMVTENNLTGKSFGLLGSAGLSAGAFLVTPWSVDGIPDIQLTVFPTVSEPHLVNTQWSENATSTESLLSGNQMLVTVALITPEARHWIVLNETHPVQGNPNFVLPTGRSKYLTENDVSKLAWGVQEVRRILTFPPMQQLVTTEVSPGAVVVDESLREWIDANVYPNSHWVGTAQMGDEETAVVDPTLKLRGVDNLHVADASVIPWIPNGNVHSTVVMISSLAADMILNESNFNISFFNDST